MVGVPGIEPGRKTVMSGWPSHLAIPPQLDN